MKRVNHAIRARRWLLPIAHAWLVFLTLSAAVAVGGCGEKIKPSIANTSVAQDVPAQESWNAVITFTDSGRVTAVVHAGHIAVYPQRKVTVLDEGIRIDFFDEHEQHTSVLTAERGSVDDATNDLAAYGNVVVVSDSGTTLKTQELFWNNSTQRVHTQAYVEIISPEEMIQGHGMESDHSLLNYRIFSVTGQAVTKE